MTRSQRTSMIGGFQAGLFSCCTYITHNQGAKGHCWTLKLQSFPVR